MGRRNLLFICAICVSFGLAGQKRNNVWAFGDGAGLNFNSTPVTPFYSATHPIAPPYYVSSICTESGQLLFYTDGKNIFNTYNQVLPKYNDWWPWYGYVIPLVVPYIHNDSLYYIFGVDYDPINGSTVSKLQYITTKMYKPGDIEESVYPTPVDSYSYYTTLLTDCSQVLAGTGHCNQQDRWITAHSPGALYSFLITSAGVNSVPVITKVPASVLPDKNLNVNYSNLKFSANGERLIIPVNDRNQIVVYDFDNQSGKFSNPIVLSIPSGLNIRRY